jgi:alkanesulfonate monooxygenase SsuD/methylene tetrahydromethanopterin reductase-like flavin-dependent oxidoreductase (luciferase family)
MKSRFLGLGAIVASMSQGRGAAVGLPAMDISPAPKEVGTDADGRNLAADKGQAGFGFGGLQFCGSPETVVKQIAEFHELTGIGVLDVSFGGAGLTPEEAQRSFRLFASEVLPRIRSIGSGSSARAESTAAAN